MNKIKNRRKQIKLVIYDVEFEVTINTQEVELYRKAAQYVTNRYAAYYDHYRESKTDFEIGLFAMLDIVVTKCKSTEVFREDDKSPKVEISLEMLDYSIDVTIPQTSEEFYRSAAETVSQSYSDYYEHYKDEKDEHEIILMTLLDLALAEYEYE